jgi:hypothetical protein
MLRVYIDVPETIRPKATYTFGMMATRWRIPLLVVQDPTDAHFEYSALRTGRSAVHVPFEPCCYEPRTRFEWAEAGGAHLWKAVGSATADPIGAAYRLLTYLDESQIQPEARDRMGQFFTEALPQQRRVISSIPVIEEAAERMLRGCFCHWPALEYARLPIWPNGKKYAVAVTHDVDHVHARSAAELAVNAAKTVLYRDVRFARLCILGLRARLRPGLDPYFMFTKWREMEKRENMRSAFYVFFRPKGHPAAPHDCKSFVNSDGDWEVMRGMADSGWEVGLHAPIRMKTAEAFTEAKRRIEERLGRAIHGVRHHYLALEPTMPYDTHRAHAEAGFEYDSSIAWRDAAGFRAGTCLPFTPFHHVRNEVVPIVVLPFTIMDTHVLNVRRPCTTQELDQRISHCAAVLARIKELGGMAILNWHQETACAQSVYERHLDVLKRLLQPLLADDDAWITTPRSICTQWKTATKRLLSPTAAAPVHC